MVWISPIIGTTTLLAEGVLGATQVKCRHVHALGSKTRNVNANVALTVKKIPLSCAGRAAVACGVDPKRVDRVFSWCLCPRRGPGARDNAHNEIVSNRNSQSTLVSEQELEQQEHTELAHVIVQSPGEAMRLLTIVLNHYY
ncbi:tumor necrosis factor receptor superfamily member 10A-like isoform X8 [Pteropus vampyrus]|uniref:Tumor necrosis factor receptor superfamily member 10A-like isoform X8 n=1 Tax=Pteropus vampyrus TaxID=132908 RepID=A0A6P6BTE0_PTEVA|nr:tumor necrosis factor receptor superfamily member 10A-like isoform X8 [Pteropus vampyrus]